MTSKKKIIFIIPSLIAGGAERVMSFVASNIDKNLFDVTIWITGYKKDTKYNIDNVDVLYFNKSRVLNAIPNIYSSLRKYRPNLVISSISHVNITMAMISVFFPKIKFIGREANVLSIKKELGEHNSIFSGLSLVERTYGFLDLILCQSRDMFNDMKLNYNIPVEKMCIINNPMTDGFNLKESKTSNNKTVQFITVASLKKQKGHERIIQSISKLNIPYHYTIVGDGSEKESIFNLIVALGISKNVTHVPYTNEVSKYLAIGDFFLQGSFVEGFPNALIESCSVGTPIIAYDALGGLNEIIEEGVNGFICKDDEMFIENIIKATTIKTWKPEEVRATVVKKFNTKKIINEYEQLFLDVLK